METAPEQPGDNKLEAGNIFNFKGYEVSVVVRDETDNSPAWSTLDARTGKRIILILEGLPKNLIEPLLEHEVYEIENGFNHEKAVVIGRKKAEELGVLADFLEFENEWDKKKKDRSE